MASTARATYPMSSAQTRVWLDQQLHPSTLFYHISHVLEIEGELHVEILCQAIKIVVERHDILRSVFFEQDGEPVQQVLDAPEIQVHLTDLTAYNDNIRNEFSQRLVDQELRRPFHLTSEFPFRIHLVQLEAKSHLLVLVIHHIAGDHWSMGVLYRELSQIYNALKHGQTLQLPPLPIQYRDYAVVERQQDNGQLGADQDFWLKQLGGELPILDLPYDKPRPRLQTNHGRIESDSLPLDVWHALTACAIQLRVTPFVLLFSAFAVLLHRLTGQTDLLIGTFLANRARKELIPLIGILFNNLPIRINLEEDPIFANLASQVQNRVLEAFAHADYSYDRLVQQLSVPRVGNRPALYNTSFQLYYQRHEDTLQLEGLKASRRRIVDDVLYDLMGYAQEKNKALQLWFNYNTDVFEADTILRILRYFVRLLTSISRDATLPISRLALISTEEERLLVEEFNDTVTAYPRDMTLHGLFQQQAARTPQQVAVMDPIVSGKVITYAMLDGRVNQLARYLERKGVRPRHIVGILLERSIDMIVAYLSILKIGAICLVLDIDLPRERLRYVTRDAQARWVITTHNIDSRHYLRSTVRQIEINDEAIDQETVTNFDSYDDAQALAAIIYTSGSSGRPKGVALCHRGIINQVHHRMNILRLSQDDILCLSLSTSFVTMPLQMFSALLVGAPLIIYPPFVVRDPEQLLRNVDAHMVTVVEMTVSGLSNFLDAISISKQPKVPLESLRMLLVAGEKLTPIVASAFYRHYDHVVLMNAYGQTECSGMTLSMPIPKDSNLDRIREGYPSQNNQVYIFDEQGALTPFGVKGEIYVSGDGLARGYIGKPSMTQEKFLPHPFRPGDVIYRTGDIGRRWPDGIIEVLGRVDDLVKIRGFRVEPGEVAAILKQHPAIRQVYVAPHTENGHTQLVAYYIAVHGAALDQRELRTFLVQYLPTYMIPYYFERLEAFPYTANGKVDKLRFPPPTKKIRLARFDRQDATDLERVIMLIWEEVLGIKGIDPFDDFFDLNGHSLHAVQIASRISHHFGIEFQATFIFSNPTVARLAPFLARLINQP